MQRTNPNLRTIELQVSVKSTHPNIETTVLLQQIEAAQEDLRRYLTRRVNVRKLSLRRRGTLPFDLSTAVITIAIMIGSEFTKEIAKSIANDTYKWLKGKWQDARFVKCKPAKTGKTADEKKKTLSTSPKRKNLPRKPAR